MNARGRKWKNNNNCIYFDIKEIYYQQQQEEEEEKFNQIGHEHFELPIDWSIDFRTVARNLKRYEEWNAEKNIYVKNKFRNGKKKHE